MDDIEAQKRINYFDLGRDDFMALEEYLLSGLSDKDLGKAKGGIMDINQMTRPVHMEGGGETKTATASGMHPLVEWEEIYDAWIIDGGEEMPLWDFIEMMTKGIKKG